MQDSEGQFLEKADEILISALPLLEQPKHRTKKKRTKLLFSPHILDCGRKPRAWETGIKLGQF